MLNALAQNTIVRKVRDFFILDPDEGEYSEHAREETRGSGGKVLAMPNSEKNIAVRISDPLSTADARKAVDELRSGKVVISNLARLEKDMQKEYLHFISGAAYALSGNCKKVGPGVFLFSPASIPISDVEDMLSEKAGVGSGLFIDEI